MDVIVVCPNCGTKFIRHYGACGYPVKFDGKWYCSEGCGTDAAEVKSRKEK